GRIVMQRAGGRWTDRASLGDHEATCLALTPNGLMIGTTQAHLFFLQDTLEPVESFETVEGRETWYTPWGDPADVRSIAVALDNAIYVNVHVGGVVRSRDAGRRGRRQWTSTRTPTRWSLIPPAPTSCSPRPLKGVVSAVTAGTPGDSSPMVCTRPMRV